MCNGGEGICFQGLQPRKHCKEQASKHVHYFVIQLKLRCGENKIVGESEYTVENLLL